jgi:CMP-N-acetylneuraminic acid synthetase
MLESTKDLLIFIPAQSGSKEFLAKNDRILGDIPLLCCTVQAVRHSSVSEAACILVRTSVSRLQKLANPWVSRFYLCGLQS